MCGIAGIFTQHQPVTQQSLAKMAETLAHRGPDQQGFWLEKNKGFAHTRLSIIDLTGGQQPLHNEQQTLQLVANGEIYNYLELRQQLSKTGQSFSTHSDSEIILRGYAQQGTNFIHQLEGMFAFALFDTQKNQLLLARDRLGIKPLYYCNIGGQFIFASEIKAILSVLDKTPAINPKALIQYLQNQFSTGKETIFKNIYRLPPGECLTVNAQLEMQSHRYWSALDVEPQEIDQNTAQTVFNQLFDQVMEKHLRSDVPLGLFLSGGVDSAILAAALSRLHNQPIRSFSVGFDQVRMQDELSDAARIAQLFNTDHTELKLTQKQIFQQIPHTIWAADDLMRDFASLPTAILAQHAAKELKVVFSGEGGDEAFAGYGRYRPSKLEAGFKNLFYPGSGGFRTRGQWRHPWPNRIFSDTLKRYDNSYRQPFIDSWQQTPASWSDLQRRQYLDLHTALPDNLLVKADRMMMAFGLEGRVPFVDHQIIEFGLSLPDHLKIQSGQGKVFLKKWASQFLPKDHLWMKKRGFHVPLNEWFSGQFLTDLEKKMINNPAINQWFNPKGITQLIKKQQQSPRYSREIAALMQFAIWHNIYIENNHLKPDSQADPLAWMS